MPPDETLVWVVQTTGDFPCNYCSRSETVWTWIFTVDGERRIFGTLESKAFPRTIPLVTQAILTVPCALTFVRCSTREVDERTKVGRLPPTQATRT